jgi:transposase, IS5 family
MELFVPMSQGFGRKQKRRATLEARKDPLLALNHLIEWELFRIVWREIEPTPVAGKAGRKPIDRLVLFKMLLVQQLYNISDEQLEYQVHDRLSFRRLMLKYRTPPVYGYFASNLRGLD